MEIGSQYCYAVRSVGGSVYVMSDNGWQSAWLVTDAGVIVFDVPANFGRSIPSKIAKVTNKPIKMFLYSRINRVAGVDVWLESHVRTAILYVQWTTKREAANLRNWNVAPKR